MSPKNITGFRIKTIRERLGFTQERVCAKLWPLGIDIDRTALAKIENGTRRIYDFELKALARVLKTTSSCLLDE